MPIESHPKPPTEVVFLCLRFVKTSANLHGSEQGRPRGYAGLRGSLVYVVPEAGLKC